MVAGGTFSATNADRLKLRSVRPAGLVHLRWTSGRAALHLRRTLRRGCEFSLGEDLAGG